jgi:integrase
LKNIVVKLVTRPTIKGKRQFVPVNPKHNYPGDTVFILRWLPEGTTTYRTKTLPRGIGLKMAQMACASFEPPTVKEAKEEEQENTAKPQNLAAMRSAFLLDKNTTFKKDGTPLDADTIHSYELVTAEFIKVTGRTKAGQITKQDMRNWIIKLKGRMAHRSVCNLYILVACFLKFCGIDHKTLLPQSERPTPVAHPPTTYSQEEMTKFFFHVVAEREALAFEFLLKTGARKTEMTYLDWESNLPNLDSLHPTVKFFTKMGFRVKTGKYREVPLEKGLAAKLRAWRKQNPATYLVFGTAEDAPEENYLRAGKNAAERSGMKRSKFKLHRLRDTFATWHLRAGVDIRTVQAWLGHATVEMTMKYLAPQEGEEAQRSMNCTFADRMSTAAAAV